MTHFLRVLNLIVLALTATIQAHVLRVRDTNPNQVVDSSKHYTHLTRTVRPGLDFEIYHPPSTFEVFDEKTTQRLAAFVDFDWNLEEETVSFVQSHLSVGRSEIGFTSGYTSESSMYGYVKQIHDGIPFINAVANVAWKDSTVVSFGSSFVQPNKIAPSKPTLDVNTAISKAEEILQGQFDGFTPSLGYLARPDGSANLVYIIQIRIEDTVDLAHGWFETFVDAHTGEVLSLTDFVAEAIVYNVIPFSKVAPPDGFELVSDPQDLEASPGGWHNGTGAEVMTKGNNVMAFCNGNLTSLSIPSTPRTPRSSASNSTVEFNYRYQPLLGPSISTNIDAGRVNGFYIANSVHDFFYRYGFTEVAFNFQDDNFGKGGQGGDAVRLSVQDSSRGVNNAFFETGPDGQPGSCLMSLWNYANPSRDASLENDILIHELTHGLTNRMIGGGTARCLQTTEARGLGEGWSDAVASWALQSTPEVRDFVMGTWVFDNPAGVRTYPYSTSNKTNPLLYSNLQGTSDRYLIGQVWANTLHNVYASLVSAYGYDKDAKKNPDGIEGNVKFLRLLIDSLALQPCNPTMVEARTAWILADKNRYGGVNSCLLWKTFASKGLGVSATKAVYVDNFNVPEGC
ncbi:metalloprotease MEP2 [Pluteus cervinus]|uniref:Metalloprotease MEP2 n=1 Tax=Pluteus cervinus TaxID=181527 RepID=A0ACD3AR61_9AGAR|nr:metalloprotease MEP2 [Pluteus cervinus]